MKRVAPNWWIRLKSGYRFGLTVFIAAVGIIGAVITGIASTGTLLNRWVIGGSFALCCSIGLLAGYVKGRVTLLPDSLVDEMGSDGGYVCTFCSPANLREACELTRPYYRHEYVAPDTAVAWLGRNPRAFVEMINAEGILCACFGILPLEFTFMEQFIKGRLEDLQLQPDDICSPEDMKKCKRLYISGVIVRDHARFAGRKRAHVMIWAMLQYIKMIYGLRTKRTLYALAVTKESERLMKNLGFWLVGEEKHRRDRCNIYSYELTAQSWQKMHASVGDWSGGCRCSYG